MTPTCLCLKQRTKNKGRQQAMNTPKGKQHKLAMLDYVWDPSSWEHEAGGLF